jgi:hypothetical protein
MITYRSDQWLRLWALGFAERIQYSDDTQLSLGGLDSFVENLAKVWQRVASLSKPTAKLYIRFGALPSQPVDTAELLKSSLRLANSPWRLKTIIVEPPVRTSNRQATQMGCHGGKNTANLEITAVAHLCP